MAFAKKQKIAEVLIFSFLIVFPFGRLLVFEFPFLGYRFSLVLLDLIAFLSLIYFVFLGKTKDLFQSHIFITFLLPLLFSFIYSIFLFWSFEVIVGFFYMLRLLFYLGFSFFLLDFLKENKTSRGILFYGLISALFFSLLFGFFQYFVYPDLTALKFLGWDDHLFRMTGTFLDPAFTGVIFIFGFILSWVRYKFTSRRFFLALALLFLVGISLTFSRASYISLLVVIFYFIFGGRSIKTAFVLILFALSLVFIPKPAGEGVNLARLYSIADRIQNYKETFSIFSYSPVFGVGFNNLCLARKIYLLDGDIFSHSCSGSNSSLLLILATLGVVGFMIFSYLGFGVVKKVREGELALVMKASLLSLLVHSQFDNSLFYPWVLGFLAIIFALNFSSNAKIEQ